jgi:hypothetical protein
MTLFLCGLVVGIAIHANLNDIVSFIKDTYIRYKSR